MAPSKKKKATRRPLINSAENKNSSWWPGFLGGESPEKPELERSASASSEEETPEKQQRAMGGGDAVSFMSEDDAEFAEIMATETQDTTEELLKGARERRKAKAEEERNAAISPTDSENAIQPISLFGALSVEDDDEDDDESGVRAMSPVSDLMSERTESEIKPSASTVSDNQSEVAVMLERGRSYQKNKDIERQIEAKAAEQAALEPKKYEYKPKDYYDQKIYDELKRTGTFRSSRSTSPRRGGERGIERVVSFKGIGDDGSESVQSKPPVILPPNQAQKRNQSKTKTILKKPPQADKPPQEEAPELVYLKQWMEKTKNYVNLLFKVNCASPDFKEDPDIISNVPKAV